MHSPQRTPATLFSADAGDGATRPVREYVPSGFPAGGAYGASLSDFPGAVNAAVGVGDGVVPSRAVLPGHAADHRADTAAAAEWRALYGASADMMNSTARTFRAGGAGVSYMTPIFHLTAHDATILAMAHNNHCKLLGIATSKKEILVTWTQLMPVIENMGVLQAQEDDPFSVGPAAPVDERLLEWDPATMSILIDELPYLCTELVWAPWQQGIYLAGLCPGHGIRLYRYSHGHWALDDTIRSTESVSCSISNAFTVACACSRGRVELWTRGQAAAPHAASAAVSAAPAAAAGTSAGGGATASEGSSWVLRRTLTLPLTEEEDGGRGGGGGGGPSPPAPAAATRQRPRDIVSVGWDESGALLAAGDQGGAVYVVAATHDSTRLGEVLYHQPPSASCGSCKQVSWSPSAGRSFVSLAMVFTTCVRVVLFCRPRLMNAAGLSHAAHGSGTGGRTGAPHGGAASPAAAALQVLATAQVPCEEIAKLSWNNTGTRFVTAHLDSSVNIWALDVRYQHSSTAKGDGATAAGHHGGRREEVHTAHGTAMRNGRAGTPATASAAAPSDTRLSVVVSVRRTSAVHPYNAVSK
ncbi:hypothetical protein NESM_000842800 [Novymonas esmeraldas]|uniref:Uncharacterized protein n=1 Tax=Novymonas esmeraldas TaxID=1808958 RepID=A0AAW0EY96_9TRYP